MHEQYVFICCFYLIFIYRNSLKIEIKRNCAVYVQWNFI